MFLLIFESIGTQELVVIGIVALMFLGPRKLPEYAKKIGKVMADFRNTTSEFKETWQREVSFDEEAKALRLDDLEDEEDWPAGAVQGTASESTQSNSAPEIKAIDREEFDKRVTAAQPALPYEPDTPQTVERESSPADDKRNWL